MSTYKRLLNLVLLGSLLCLTLTASHVSAQSGQIYYVSKSGDDANSGTSQDPWRTINHAVTSVPSYSTVKVLAGDYRYNNQGQLDANQGNIELNASNIKLEAESGVKALSIDISGNGNVVSGFNLGLELECERNKTGYTSDSCESDPQMAVRDTFSFGVRTTGNSNLVENNDIHHTNQDGIWFFGQNNTFRKNYIHDIAWRKSDPHVDCFQTWGDAENIVFDSNFCHNTNTMGSNQISMVENKNTTVKKIVFKNNIFVMDDPGYSPINFNRKAGQNPIENVRLLNNTFVHRFQVGTSAIFLRNITGATVINNAIYNYGSTSQPYIFVSEGSSINIGSNAIYTTTGVAPKGTPYSGDVWMKPFGFKNVSALNFELTSSSPLIDAGRDASGLSVNEDYAGTTRPLGASHDIGAYEYNSNTEPNQCDINKDGQTNMDDYSLITEDFFTQSERSDLNKNGIVDIRDYSIFTQKYSQM